MPPKLQLGAAVAVALMAAACSGSGGADAPRSTAVPSATVSVPVTSSGASAAPTTAPADWPTYHGDLRRSGVSTTMPAATNVHPVRKLPLDGAVYASPIVVDGMTVVATEHDQVYAFDDQFRQVWHADLGDPSPAQERPCGNIDPLGITGTPVYHDGTVYLVAEHGGSVRHELVGLDLQSGRVTTRRDVDRPGADPTVMQQRGALTFAAGRVWVPFGALAGDCGNYKGRVVGVPVAGGALTVFDPSPRRQGGVWNAAGGTVDARGRLYFVSANGSAFPGDDYDRTNSVNRLDATGRYLDSFAPSNWAQNNQGDVGLGSQGVALVGSRWAVLGGKSGPVYVLRQSGLGGVGGEVSQQDICPSYGGAAVVGDVVFLPCTDGVRAVRVDDAGRLHVLWHADEAITGSPVAGAGRVWALDQTGGVLHALDPSTGRTREQVDVGETSRFATPALSGRYVLVPTLAGLSVVAVA